MVTAHRCTAAGRDTGCNRADFGDSMDQRPKTLTASTVNCCMACCYSTGVTAAAPATKHYCNGKTAKTISANVARPSTRAYADYDDPPSEAAAFVASASAAAFVLLVALLAVILSSIAVLSLASLTPTAVAATEVLGSGPQAADYIHRWRRQQLPDQWHSQRQQQLFSSRLSVGGGDEDAVRQKRQLLKNVNREPGVFALAFSLIGGTISDAREAYRNVSTIVRDTISEAARAQQLTTTTAASASSAGGDQMMMAAGDNAENEVSTTAPVDQKLAGDMFGKLFGRNYRGLRRLFNSELRTALKNSPGNVRDFAVELVSSVGQSLRPSNLFSRGPINGNSATTGSRR